MPPLMIENLIVHYGSVEAVRGVTLSVEAQKITVLLGSNGAGKSSVMRACMGLVPMSKGTVTAFGQSVGRMPTADIVRLGMTLCPEGRRVFARLSVAENLSLGAGSDRAVRARSGANLARMFALFPVLAERRHQAAGSLSGGEEQMLAIARALMSEPKVLLLDEPSLGLAPIIIDQIFDLLVRLRSEGLTILLVEQKAEQALRIADQACVMMAGAMVQSGPAAELLASANLSKAYLGA